VTTRQEHPRGRGRSPSFLIHSGFDRRAVDAFLAPSSAPAGRARRAAAPRRHTPARHRPARRAGNRGHRGEPALRPRSWSGTCAGWWRGCSRPKVCGGACSRRPGSPDSAHVAPAASAWRASRVAALRAGRSDAVSEPRRRPIRFESARRPDRAPPPPGGARGRSSRSSRARCPRTDVVTYLEASGERRWVFGE